MSVRVMTEVWEIDLPASDKIVLLALADCANDEGKCWPGMASLTAKCSKGERTVQASIQRLVKAGHLTRKEVLGKGCNYIVHPRKNCAPAEPAPPQKLTKTPAKSAGKPSGTVIGLADAKPKRTKHSVTEFPVPDWMPAEPWSRYLKMRDGKKAWPEPDTVELLIGKLNRWRAQGHDPGAILDNSTMNNWTGIFEPRKTGNGERPANDISDPFVRAALGRQAERAAAGH